MAEQDEGAIGADLAIGAEGAEGAMGSEGVMGAEEDRGAAIYLMLDGQDTTGIGYMALWGFAAKCRMDGWMDGVDGYSLNCYDFQSTCEKDQTKLQVFPTRGANPLQSDFQVQRGPC